MDSFQWDKHYLTDLPEVDKQHKHLVTIINEFGDLLTENELDEDDVEAVFKELSEYAVYHFQEEENFMARLEIDQRHIEHHLDEHKRFLQEVVAMHAAMAPEKPETARQLLDFLVYWLAYHILGSDQNMARQARAIESGLSPAEAYEAEERESDSSTAPLLVALKALFHQVSTRNAELLALNQSLESKVVERTRELSLVNIRLEEMALTDALTGLPNRRYAMHCLGEFWDETERLDSHLTCMMLDADHFKEVNDTYGHDAGDQVLRKLAMTLQHSLRTDDIVCRLGGDEFFIICPSTEKAGGMQVAANIHKAVNLLQVPTSDGFWQGSISVGVATRTSDMASYDDLIKLADEGVYAAKRDGKNCVRSKN